MFNADWNEEKIAAEDSIKKKNPLHIGLNTYDPAFLWRDYFILTGWRRLELKRYGIPEVHLPWQLETKKSSYDALNIIITMVHSLALTYLEIKPYSFMSIKNTKNSSINENNTNIIHQVSIMPQRK